MTPNNLKFKNFKPYKALVKYRGKDTIMIITISLPPAAAERMKAAAKETNRTVADLATWSTKEALLDHFKDRDDPGAIIQNLRREDKVDKSSGS